MIYCTEILTSDRLLKQGVRIFSEGDEWAEKSDEGPRFSQQSPK
jgi:hypothetical protein